MTIIQEIYWVECRTDNSDEIKTLRNRKAKSSDIKKIRGMKIQSNFIHLLLLIMDERKKFVNTNSGLDVFLDNNERASFGYSKGHQDENYNVSLIKAYDLKFVNILYRVQIRLASKSIMDGKYDYCD
jgi:hypothetical protein